MTIFDYLVIFVLAASVVIGVMRGMVREILSLVSWVVAFVVANAYGAELARMLPPAIPGEVLRVMVAFIVLFIGARILVGLLAMALGALIEAGGLSALDRLLGVVFGLGRGVVIVLAVVILCGMTSIPQQAFWRNAHFSPLAESAAHALKPFLPAAMAQHVHF